MDHSSLPNVLNSDYGKKFAGRIQYGTAGFRTKAANLDHVLYRMGLLAVLRSKAKSAAIGLMITASHNAEPDNGVKLIDPAGEMLEASWERIATELANVEDSDLTATVQEIVREQKINTSNVATVITGRDTRKSSPGLLNAALAGVSALGGIAKDFGVVTTPQLHYLVVCTNTNGAYGEPTLEGYYLKLSTAFKRVRGAEVNNKEYNATLQLDAANGVGAIAVREFQRYLGGAVTVNVYNDGKGELNNACGADFVKVQQARPSGVPSTPNLRSASVDGDADRLVYFYTDEDSGFHLLDGDRIATLVAGYVKELLRDSNLPLALGLVQTAYANGGSTDYISNVLQVPVACVPTGIKHLHSKALEFDIGVYFEANGHGTVVFKEAAIKMIEDACKSTAATESERTAASKLADVMDVINQAVGDALSDLLLVETILHARGWDVVEWERSYQDLPNRQLKVKVQDRNVITTADAERRCVTPAGLQDEIDRAVAKYKRGRSFVRPSGTEDIVRVYAECEDPSEVEKLAAEISQLVYRMAGGVGGEPSLSR